MKLAVIIPYFSYGPSAIRDMMLRRLLVNLDHPQIDTFVVTVDVDLRLKLQPYGMADRWAHVNILPTTGGDVMWQKAFALNYGKAILADRQSEYYGLCLLDADADLDGGAPELAQRCESLHNTVLGREGFKEGDGFIASPFTYLEHNGSVKKTAWAEVAHSPPPATHTVNYSTAKYSHLPPGGCLYLNWDAAEYFDFCEWLPVGGDDSVYFSQAVGWYSRRLVCNDEHVVAKLRPEPDINDDTLIQGLLYSPALENEAGLHIGAFLDDKKPLKFGAHGGYKQATYVSRHEITAGHNLLHCVLHERVDNQPVCWHESAPQELRQSVKEYLERI